MSHSSNGDSPRKWFSLPRRNSSKPRRRGGHQQRRLRAETLETRRLLAADFDGFRHNAFDPEDVNDDGEVSAIDALMVINAMDRNDGADENMFTDVNDDGLRSSLDALLVINRIDRESAGHNAALPTNLSRVPGLPSEIRSIGGTGNHLENPELGSANQPLLRFAHANYADGISTPAGQNRPSARKISNELSRIEAEVTHNDRGISAFLFLWGQFLDHDIDLTESQEDQEDGESFEIPVSEEDSLFDPMGSGNVTIPFSRSQFNLDTGTSVDNPRQQISSITAYVDGSQVYGSDQATADRMRTFVGGRLAMKEDQLLRTDEEGHVIAGDIRASENISLTAMHTLFVREHNRLADEISAADAERSDEDVYQQARAVVIAEIQSITYNEFLPALLGSRAISNYEGYDSTVDPTIANEFSTAAFRFGHSTLNDNIEFYDNDGRSVRERIALSDAFFNPSLLEETGIDSILKYGASSQTQEIDLQVVDSLRNFLFGPPGAGGFDLVALNIQRGRDHGLADYDATREAYGLETVESFDQISSDSELQGKLESLYGDVSNIDLWVGLMAEDHLPGSSVGELTQAIIVDQFERLRDGDRLYYENVFEGQELRQLQNTSLADLIERNTTVEGLQDNVFFMLAEARGQVTTTPTATGNGAAVLSNQSGGGRQSTPGDSSRPIGAGGVTVELLDDEGNVIKTTLTDQSGNYRFRSFAETGDYQIRLASTGDTLDVLISNGNTRLRGLDFQVVS